MRLGLGWQVKSIIGSRARSDHGSSWPHALAAPADAAGGVVEGEIGAPAGGYFSLAFFV